MSPSKILDFWFSHRDSWFNGGEEFDMQIRETFLGVYEEIIAGQHDDWMDIPESALALIIVLDQFARNMFRGKKESFEYDFKSLYTTKNSLKHGFLDQLPQEQKSFLLMPLMHSESLPDQDLCVEMFRYISPDGTDSEYALQHREIIKNFGRFPHRNTALGRASTPEEEDFMKTHAGF